MEGFKNSYTEDLIRALHKIDTVSLEKIAAIVKNAKTNNHTIFLIGNGGSSATPSHSAGDWTKELQIKTICLSDNTPALTAFANDTDYANIFKGQLETFLSNGDVVIGYSGSGNSPNILSAIEFAKSKGNITIGITGNYNNMQGGKLSELADISLIAQTNSMERIEDIHLIVNHMIKEYLKANS